MMRTEVITGSKQEIAAKIASAEGDVREAILFIEDAAPAQSPKVEEDIFAEMEPYTVRAGGEVDYSRESIYDRTRDE